MSTATLPVEKIHKSRAERCGPGALCTEEDIKRWGFADVPYPMKLSFAPFIRYWEARLDNANAGEALLARELLAGVAANPRLREPFDRVEELAPYQEWVELAMAALFPAAQAGTQLGKVSKPFDLQPLYVTPALKRLMNEFNVKYSLINTEQFARTESIVRVCALILNQLYGQTIGLHPTMVLALECPQTSMQAFYKLQATGQFLEVIPTKPLKKLSQERINRLLANIYDLDAWLETLPPDHFEIHGIIPSYLVDITEEEILSRLKYKLLEPDAIMSARNIAELELLVRSFFRNPALRLGLTALDYPRENAVEHKYKIRFDLLAGKQKNLLAPNTQNSVYEKVCKFREILLVEDLEMLPNKTSLEEKLLEEGVRSLLLAPLTNRKGNLIGLMELASDKPYDVNSFYEARLSDLLPLFRMALERSREEVDNRIEAIIRERYTNIHPSVEWKFIRKAFKIMQEEEKTGHPVDAPPVVFEGVFPLYAQADIVGSSSLRNQAIQADFIDNLEAIQHVLQLADAKIDFPLVRHYLHETKARLEQIRAEINSSDENLILEFIKEEVHPLLKELRRRDSDLSFAVSKYFDQLDPELGIIYRKRKDFETSVSRLNDAISEYLDIEETRAQQMIPHYFEKYRTDGVEFEIYAGQSLLKSGTFSPVHLKNLRLWQLITVCEITRMVERLEQKLPVPLKTAQLVFVFNNPIAIRFRLDEKRFDVDGAYNIRYEIIKKRIDKAYIEGTRERLTQPGKIAIVYSVEADRQEYEAYLQHLIREGYIEPEIEDLALGKLQGVQGLRALRVRVKAAQE